MSSIYVRGSSYRYTEEENNFQTLEYHSNIYPCSQRKWNIRSGRIMRVGHISFTGPLAYLWPQFQWYFLSVDADIAGYWFLQMQLQLYLQSQISSEKSSYNCYLQSQISSENAAATATCSHKYPLQNASAASTCSDKYPLKMQLQLLHAVTNILREEGNGLMSHC